MGCTPPWADTPRRQTPFLGRHYLGWHRPWADTSLPRQTPHWQTLPPRQTPPCADTPLGRHPLPLPRWPLQRTVRFLLECILVINRCAISSDTCYVSEHEHMRQWILQEVWSVGPGWRWWQRQQHQATWVWVPVSVWYWRLRSRSHWQDRWRSADMRDWLQDENDKFEWKKAN